MVIIPHYSQAGIIHYTPVQYLHGNRHLFIRKPTIKHSTQDHTNCLSQSSDGGPAFAPIRVILLV